MIDLMQCIFENFAKSVILTFLKCLFRLKPKNGVFPSIVWLHVYSAKSSKNVRIENITFCLERGTNWPDHTKIWANSDKNPRFDRGSKKVFLFKMKKFFFSSAYDRITFSKKSFNHWWWDTSLFSTVCQGLTFYLFPNRFSG